MTPIRFRDRKQRAKRSGVFVMKREARTRFFFFSGSFLLLLVCLLVTPTSATAPQAKKTVPAQNEPRQQGPVARAADGPQTLEPRQQDRRPAIRASRDERRTAARGGRIRLTEREMELLARLVYAEGRGEPYEGQVAIAAVVLNRVESPQFPNTVREVIFAPNAFSPVKDGHLSQKTNDTARKAVRDAVNGLDPSRGSLYFYNPKTATSEWIRTRPQTVRIANHVFAR
jgi:N-acetylmuramoyl-L-alanine amidase